MFVRLIGRRFREKPGANAGEADERLIAGLARRLLQRRCDRVVELSDQVVRKRAGRVGPANRGKTGEQCFDRRSCAA